MTRGRKYLSKGVSLLFHPLLIPTMACFLLYAIPADMSYIVFQTINSQAVISVLLFLTFLWTCIVPLVCLFVLKKSGRISSFYLTVGKERSLPYLYTLAGYVGWCISLNRLQISRLFFLIAIGVTSVLLLVYIINHYWQISAHSAGVGGLLGGMLALSVSTGIVLWGGLTTIGVLSFLIMSARIYLNAHNWQQCVIGWLTGVFITVLPACIYYA